MPTCLSHADASGALLCAGQPPGRPPQPPLGPALPLNGSPGRAQMPKNGLQ